MLRVLLCMTCCSAPPPRSAKRRASSSANSTSNTSEEEKKKKKIEEASKTDFKSLVTLTAGEKEQLIASKQQQQQQQGNEGHEHILARAKRLNSDATLTAIEVEDSLTASTSLATLKNVGSTNNRKQLQRQLAVDAEDLSKRLALASGIAARDLNQSYADADQESISTPSSIDIGQFTENPRGILPQSSGEFDQREDLESSTANDHYKEGYRSYKTQSKQRPIGQNDTLLESSGSKQSVPTSVTKIGDYARLEYSPVEDLESVTSKSRSRVGSEKSGSRPDGLSSTLSRRNSTKTTEGSISRQSSQGVESSSISIASLLSGEQLQQNLTNMLETANSPIPMYGTIGLPLGPPLEATYTETAKTSPETTGAALTSNSQDSLSDASLENTGQKPVSRPLTFISTSSNTGGALVSSIEDSMEISQNLSSDRGEDRASKISESTTVAQDAGVRVGSPLSMSTTTSGGLTNPTPTPSEMSGGSGKKKSRLRPKSLLKRLKGKKKNKDDSENVEEK